MLAGLSLAASLSLTSLLTPAPAAPVSLQGKQVTAPPSSAPVGAPITLTVYNYLPNPQTVYVVSPTKQLGPPLNTPVPPITASGPVSINTFVGTTLYFHGPKGWVTWKHISGVNPNPTHLIGRPTAGQTTPPGYVAKTPSGKGGTPPATPGGTPPAAPGAPPVIVNKSVVNKTVVNKPPPASVPGPGGKRRPNAPNIDITINPPSAPSADAPAAPGEPPRTTPPPATTAKDDSSGELHPPSADDAAIVEFLRIHNAARAEVGVAPLEWSEDLAITAQEWAEELAGTGKLEHRPDSEYGENLASGKGNYTPASAANTWLAEKASYSPDNVEYRVTTPAKGKGKKASKHEEDVKTAHYSQMVWGKSTVVGVGIAMTTSGKVVVVANYNPRGNIKGEKPYEH